MPIVPTGTIRFTLSGAFAVLGLPPSSVLRSAAPLAVGHDEGVVDALPDPLALPAAQIIIDRLPRRQVIWQQPPRHAGPQKIEDGVHQFVRRGLPGPPACLRVGDQRREQFPLRVGQVSVVPPSCGRLPLCYRAAARIVGPTPYESRNSRLGNLEASVRSRSTEARGRRDRDLIEAGLSEPAGWQASYGDCVCGGRSESCRRVSGGAISRGRVAAVRVVRAFVALVGTVKIDHHINS